MDPLLQYKLGSGLFGSQSGGALAVATKPETPFYVKSGKTSAEIIEEAKATMAIKSAGAAVDDSSLRAAVRTVDTKRPFTPRQTDRRLYHGSTNHVARPPSSFRLLPLPEEELSRPLTAPRLTSGSSRRGSNDGYAENRLPVILPHINLTLPAQQHQLKKSAKGEARRTQFRASSLCDVLEISEQTEPAAVPEPKPASGERKKAAAARKTTWAGGDACPAGALLEQLDQELTDSWPRPQGPVRARSVDYGSTAAEAEPETFDESPVGRLLARLREPQLMGDREATLAGLESLYDLVSSGGRPKSSAAASKHNNKGAIIKTLCLYVDTESPRVLILVVQILLALGVRRQNLATAYKLTYKAQS